MGLFSGLTSAAGGLFGDATAIASRYQDRQTAEALVAVLIGAAMADGEKEAGEIEKIRAAFTKHPVLKQYDSSFLNKKLTDLLDGFSLDTAEGLSGCLKELRDIADKPSDQREAVMRMGAMIAKADGEVEGSERDFLRDCAATLYLDPAKFGL
jgi:tellurite resistance protein